MNLRSVEEKEELVNDSNKLRHIMDEIKDGFNKRYDEQFKEFMYQWNLERDKENPITSDEYYAVMRFVQFLKDN